MSEQKPLDLGRRERQIVEVLYQLGEGSVSDVLAALPDPPTYSAVRGMLNLLVSKGVVGYRQEGKRYLYRPMASKEKVRRSALRDLVRTFFSNQPADAAAALVDGTAGRLTPDDLRRLREVIDTAERQQQARGKSAKSSD